MVRLPFILAGILLPALAWYFTPKIASQIEPVVVTISDGNLEAIHEAAVRYILSKGNAKKPYFNYYCLANNPRQPYDFHLPENDPHGFADPPKEDPAFPVHPDPSISFLQRFEDLPHNVVASTECVQSPYDGELRHGATGATPVLDISIGPMVVLGLDRVNLGIFTTGGFLTETYSILEMELVAGEWKVLNEGIVLQA